MNSVRVGVIGMGIGLPMAKGIASNSRGSIVALCDLIEERMDTVAAKLPTPVRYFTDHVAMCRDPEIDAVIVATPNQFHVSVALEAIRNNKHVLITKPLADALAPAQQVVAAAEAAGVVNMMSLSTRFDAPAQYLGGLRADGVFGDIYYARARSIRRSGIPSWSPGFVRKGGGAFRDMGVHCLDAAWWLMGMPQPVSVTGVAGAKFGPRGLGYWHFAGQPTIVSEPFEADDYAAGLIRFEDGQALHIESFWASHQPEDFQVELFGTDAGARLSPLAVYRTENGAPTDSTIELPVGPTVWERIGAHFIACILDGVVCQAPLRHGMIVQELLEALLESAETGKELGVGRTGKVAA
ncbi:MAG: Gfo/Idh/MocA family oxidoreductase [Herpetosiphonaceae bacterium]|nr:Gfo/Idh/MocA family oxidoreductase [Herpetosiphonaceae bacterium]